MAIRPQASFAAGELDPALIERVTLEKYNSGLTTLRNWYIGKTGSIITSPGWKTFKPAFDSKVDSILWSNPYSDYFLEVSLIEKTPNMVERIRIHKEGSKTVRELNFYHANTNADLSLEDYQFSEAPLSFIIPFADSETRIVLIFTKGIPTRYFIVDLNSTPDFPLVLRFLQPGKPGLTVTSETGTGIDVQYVFSFVSIDGIESQLSTVESAKLPKDATETNTYSINMVLSTPDLDRLDHVKAYRRPVSGEAYGYIGKTYNYVVTPDTPIPGLNQVAFSFIDRGIMADYTQQPPDYYPEFKVTFENAPNPLPGKISHASAGIYYQDRLILDQNKEIHGSRTRLVADFTRDFPLTSESALAFKAGRGYNARLLRFSDIGKLAAWTTGGLYVTPSDVLEPVSAFMSKKGPWVIDPRLEPLQLPGAIFIVEASQGAMLALNYSEELNAFTATDITAYNSHLFKNRRIVSWCYEAGLVSKIHCVMSDGELLTFTYQEEQMMSAWARRDSDGDFKSICAVKSINSKTVVYAIVDRNGERHIERLVDRFLNKDELVINPEADKGETSAAMDAFVSWSHLILDDLNDDDLTIEPAVPGNWAGRLKLLCVNDGIFTDPGIGEEGTVFRWFNPKDRTSIDLVVIERTDDNEVAVEPSEEFPSEYALNPRLYETRSVFKTDEFATLHIPLSGYSNPITVAPKETGNWAGNLIVTVTPYLIWEDVGYRGQKLYFRKTDGSILEMRAVGTHDDDELEFEIVRNGPFPSGSGTNPALYMQRFDTFYLHHMEGKKVSVLGDGNVLASPNNNVDNYTEVIVTNGEVEIPEASAFVHVGLPYTMDVQTLEPATVEQRPIQIESKTVNKVYVKTFESRGMFIGNRFPANDKLEGDDITGTTMVAMDGADSYDVNYEEQDPILGNRYLQPSSRRLEVNTAGDWKENGKICIRQVDPVHAEILSIILDIEDLRR